MKSTICSLCHKNPAAYKKTNHCRACHSAYNRSKYEDRCIEAKIVNKRMVLRSNRNKVRYQYECIGAILTLERKEIVQELIRTRHLERGMVNVH